MYLNYSKNTLFGKGLHIFFFSKPKETLKTLQNKKRERKKIIDNKDLIEPF